MADQEHVKRLMQGVAGWNQWRQEQPSICPDLSRAYLGLFHLREADLSDSNLSDSNFSGVNLVSANLFNANLSGANLWGANLINANLGHANLRYANLSRANLHTANLSYANLTGVSLSGTNLKDTNFSDASLLRVVFAWVDLRSVKGLDTANHYGPSSVDINSVVLPNDEGIRKHFLRGTGFLDTFIGYLPSLLSTPIQYQSCFIGYSNKDDSFARKLYADLQERGVRCWFSLEDLKIGDHYHQRIDESIHLYDKLILILSEQAVQSAWVEREMVAAREKEDHLGHEVLFPLRLDDAVMQTNKAWAADVRRRWHIGDFTQWKDHDTYQMAFERLLRDLKAEQKPKD